MQWFLTTEPRPAARFRVICFPHAGAGAAVFRDWSHHFPGSVEVKALQLPGRGWRIRETPIRHLAQAADAVADAVEPLTDLPYLLFGHSFGAWLGLLVAQRLERRGVPPVRLVASGRRAPSYPHADPPMRALDDAGFVHEIQRRYGAIHPDIVDDADLLELLLPALRADVEALERYEHPPGPHVECPITAMGGTDDPIVPVRHLDSWDGETAGSFDCTVFPGGHFFFQDDPEPLLDHLRSLVEENRMAGVDLGVR